MTVSSILQRATTNLSFRELRERVDMLSLEFQSTKQQMDMLVMAMQCPVCLEDRCSRVCVAMPWYVFCKSVHRRSCWRMVIVL